jgi:hypothetical protein
MASRWALSAVAVLCTLASGAPARADAPPYATTDTGIADKLEFTGFAQSITQGRIGVDVLGLDLAIPLAPRWEMTIVPRMAVVSDGDRRAMGVGDTEIAVKYLVLPETNALPAIAIEPNLTIPTGGRRLGDGQVAIEVPVLISKAFGAWRVSGQVGYARDGFDGRADHAPVSLLLERTIAKNFSLGVEIANDLPMRRPSRGSAQVNLGGSWAIRDGLVFEAALGHRLASASEPADLHSCFALAIEF